MKRYEVSQYSDRRGLVHSAVFPFLWLARAVAWLFFGKGVGTLRPEQLTTHIREI